MSGEITIDLSSGTAVLSDGTILNVSGQITLSPPSIEDVLEYPRALGLGSAGFTPRIADGHDVSAIGADVGPVYIFEDGRWQIISGKGDMPDDQVNGSAYGATGVRCLDVVCTSHNGNAVIFFTAENSSGASVLWRWTRASGAIEIGDPYWDEANSRRKYGHHLAVDPLSPHHLIRATHQGVFETWNALGDGVVWVSLEDAGLPAIKAGQDVSDRDALIPRLCWWKTKLVVAVPGSGVHLIGWTSDGPTVKAIAPLNFVADMEPVGEFLHMLTWNAVWLFDGSSLTEVLNDGTEWRTIQRLADNRVLIGANGNAWKIGVGNLWSETLSHRCVAPEGEVAYLSEVAEKRMTVGQTALDPQGRVLLAEGVNAWMLRDVPEGIPSADTTLYWESVGAGLETLVIRDLERIPGSDLTVVAAMDRAIFISDRREVTDEYYPNQPGMIAGWSASASPEGDTVAIAVADNRHPYAAVGSGESGIIDILTGVFHKFATHPGGDNPDGYGGGTIINLGDGVLHWFPLIGGPPRQTQDYGLSGWSPLDIHAPSWNSWWTNAFKGAGTLNSFTRHAVSLADGRSACFTHQGGIFAFDRGGAIERISQWTGAIQEGSDGDWLWHMQFAAHPTKMEAVASRGHNGGDYPLVFVEFTGDVDTTEPVHLSMGPRQCTAVAYGSDGVLVAAGMLNGVRGIHFSDNLIDWATLDDRGMPADQVRALSVHDDGEVVVGFEGSGCHILSLEWTR